MKKINKFLALFLLLNFFINSQKEILADKTNFRKSILNKTEEVFKACLSTVRENKIAFLSIIGTIGIFGHNKFCSSKYKKHIKKLKDIKFTSENGEKEQSKKLNILMEEKNKLEKEIEKLKEASKQLKGLDSEVASLNVAIKELSDKLEFIMKKIRNIEVLIHGLFGLMFSYINKFIHHIGYKKIRVEFFSVTELEELRKLFGKNVEYGNHLIYNSLIDFFIKLTNSEERFKIIIKLPECVNPEITKDLQRIVNLCSYLITKKNDIPLHELKNERLQFIESLNHLKKWIEPYKEVDEIMLK